MRESFLLAGVGEFVSFHFISRLTAAVKRMKRMK
jgi:hypothetical protein